MVSSLRYITEHCLWSVRQIINIEINILKCSFQLFFLYYLQIWFLDVWVENIGAEPCSTSVEFSNPSVTFTAGRVCACACVQHVCVWLCQKYMTGRAEWSCSPVNDPLKQKDSWYHHSLALRHPLPLSFQSHASQWEWFPWQRHIGISGLWLWCICVCVCAD